MTNVSSDLINQTRALFDQSQGVLIVLGKNPSYDDVACGLSLYLASSARGKKATIVSPSPMTVEFSHLIGVDKISNSLGNVGNGNNLVISFPYQEGSIEKVSYNIENDTFNLVIEPREGYPNITSEMMRYSYSGGETDLVFSIGAQNLSDFDNIYQNNPTLFTDKPLVNIDINSQNQRFGKINLIDPGVSSISELLVNLFSALGITLDSDIASNLFAGIAAGSNNFTANTSASTFENAAICLKNGAKKIEQTDTYSPASIPTFRETPKTQVPPQSAQITPPSFTRQPVSVKNQPQRVNKPFQPPAVQKHPSTDAPPDWLKPKIYKGSTLL